MFGSKNLKAIAIRGTLPVRLADPEGFWSYNQEMLKRISRSRASGILTRYGTHGAYGVGGPDGRTPQGVRNHRDEYWPADKGMQLRETAFREKWEVGRAACFACPCSCTHVYRLAGGKYGPLTLEGVHTNTVRALGSNLDINDAEAVLKGQALINQLGLNTDGVGSVMGWAFEGLRAGALDQKGHGRPGVDLGQRRGHGWPPGEDRLQAGRRGPPGQGSEGSGRHFRIGQRTLRHACQGTGDERAVGSFPQGWALGIFTSTRGAGT